MIKTISSLSIFELLDGKIKLKSIINKCVQNKNWSRLWNYEYVLTRLTNQYISDQIYLSRTQEKVQLGFIIMVHSSHF